MLPKSIGFKKLSAISLAAVIFFTISGGPYGLEPLMAFCGGKAALLLLVVIPVFWDIPIILAVLELNGLLPMNGGYYQWVKQALGLRWAFYEGWWSWVCTFIDLAIYPQLLIMYASLFFPEIAAHKLPICLSVIWGCAFLNIIGIVPVGRASLLLSGLVTIPFILVFLFGLHYHPVALNAGTTVMKENPSYFGMGVFTIIWNFVGWDNVTTYAQEVDRPVASYIKAISGAFAFIFILYFGITLIAKDSGVSPVALKESGFPVLGSIIAGRWLAVVIAIGGMISSIGMFLAVLLSISRVPEAMSNDRLLPAKLHVLHPRYQTPYISIILCAAIVSVMVIWSFDDLLIMDVTLYFAGLILEFISIIVFRLKEPNAARPFRIPLNIAGLCCMLALPVLIYVFALMNVLATGGSLKTFLFAILLLLSADIIWRLITTRQNYQKRNDIA